MNLNWLSYSDGQALRSLYCNEAAELAVRLLDD